MSHWISAFCTVLFEECMRLIVTFGLAILITFLAMSAYIAAWELYIRTHMGQKFFEISPELATQITIFLNQESLLMFSVEVAKLTLIMAFTIAVIAHFFFLHQLLYRNAPIIFKVLICLALATGLAFYHMANYDLTSYNIAIVLFAPASLILFPACLTTANALIPDLGQITLSAWHTVRRLFSSTY